MNPLGPECQEELDLLMKAARALPPTTEQQKREQRFDFAYGNLACTTNHKPSLRAFAQLAMKQGWTFFEFCDWAKGKEWFER